MVNNEVTIVTGLWNLGRGTINESFKRSYDDYLQKFKELLKTPSPMVIFLSREDEDFIWEHRDPENTFVRFIELNEFDTWFEHFDKVQQIRTTEEWSTRASWLESSPQATLRYYNPVVMSKMFLLNDASIYNPFDSKYFFWIDAGIANTVHPGYFYHDLVFDNLPDYCNKFGDFIFLSYPYEGGEEIHGFERNAMEKYCGVDYVNYVCRGGFFGGAKHIINKMNQIYHSTLTETINNGYMGTEESIFTIMAHQHPDLIDRFELKDDGLVWPFFEALKDVNSIVPTRPKVINLESAQVSVYVLGFNSPKQFRTLCQSIWAADSKFLTKTRRILINNSTDESTFDEYDRICSKYGFEEIHRENLGVCGGRQFAAEHFEESGADFYYFFEDDMLLNGPSKAGELCKSGMIKYIPNLYDISLKIMLKEKFDFLKLSFSEFYLSNNIQVSWYNVPQHIRSEVWPDYDRLPEHGFDPNAPRTKFDTIEVLDGIAYITGQIYYGNWPQIVSREGNKKMFLDTKWAHPYEQTWMSHMFQLTLKNELRPAILLASPVNHNRFDFYPADVRKES